MFFFLNKTNFEHIWTILLSVNIVTIKVTKSVVDSEHE